MSKQSTGSYYTCEDMCPELDKFKIFIIYLSNPQSWFPSLR